MNRVFKRLGFVFVDPVADDNDDWDVLWSLEYPFHKEYEMYQKITYLKPHQKINHIHGSNPLVSKSYMSTYNRHLENVLPGFRFPEHIELFKKYSAENPKVRFIEKSKTNRGVRLVNESDINYEYSDSFYQVFMEDPFIIDERAMDFSVYVVIASISPLRVYRFDQDIHLRFCHDPYYPFDPLQVNKYVVSNVRMPFIGMPSLNHYYSNFGFSFKKSLEAYLIKKGYNVTEIWRRVDKAIADLIQSCEPAMTQEVN